MPGPLDGMLRDTRALKLACDHVSWRAGAINIQDKEVQRFWVALRAEERGGKEHGGGRENAASEWESEKRGIL